MNGVRFKGTITGNPEVVLGGFILRKKRSKFKNLLRFFRKTKDVTTFDIKDDTGADLIIKG